MEYIVNNITDNNGIDKLQVYKVIGAEAINGDMVDTKVFDGEYTRDEILLQIHNIKEIGSDIMIAEIEGKLGGSYTDEEIISALNRKAEVSNARVLDNKKINDINVIATLSDQLNLLAGILEEIILEKVESERTPLQKQGLIIFSKIKTILNTSL